MIRLVAIDSRDRAAYELPTALPAGAIVVGLTGERARVLADGTVEEVLEVPRRWSISASPSARRRP